MSESSVIIKYFRIVGPVKGFINGLFTLAYQTFEPQAGFWYGFSFWILRIFGFSFWILSNTNPNPYSKIR